MVTKFPNHWWASSCPTTSATHCLEEEQEFFGSMRSAVSLWTQSQLERRSRLKTDDVEHTGEPAPTGFSHEAHLYVTRPQFSMAPEEGDRSYSQRFQEQLLEAELHSPAAKSAMAMRSILGRG